MRNKILIGLVSIFLIISSTYVAYLISQTGTPVKPSESYAKPSVNSTPKTEQADWKERFNQPLKDSDIPESLTLKFGKTYAFVHDLKVTVSAPDQVGNFTVTLDAPYGWVKESDDKMERSNIVASTVGEFSCPGPFSEDILPNTSKTYDCYVGGFGTDSMDYLAIDAAGFTFGTWTLTGKSY